MTGDELKEARQALGLTLVELGHLLGYAGEHVRAQVHKMETGDRPIKEAQRRLVEAYLEGYRPADWPLK